MESLTQCPIIYIRGVCAICLEEGKLRCSRCGVTYYCGVDCQRSAWKSHKPRCSLLHDGKSEVVNLDLSVLSPVDIPGAYAKVMMFNRGYMERVLMLRTEKKKGGTVVEFQGLHTAGMAKNRREKIVEKALGATRRRVRAALYEIEDEHLLLLCDFGGPYDLLEYSPEDKRVISFLF